LNDIPIPEPGPNQVLMKVVAASICHSDLMQNLRPDGPPVTLGHEGVGIVEKLHPSAEGKGFKKGDRVGALYFNGCCYECEGCNVHQLHCKSDWKLMGMSNDGFFGEYTVVDWQNLAHLPDDIQLNKYSPIFCAGITAFHAVDQCDLKPGDWFAVVGCGGLGQLAAQYAKAMGAKVLGVDINDATLEVFKKQGGDLVYNSRSNPNYIEELKKATGGGAHAVAVFSDANAAYAGAPKVLRVGGLLMCVGLPKDPISIPVIDLCCGTIRVKGESTSIPSRMQKAVDFTIKHNILPEVEFRKLEELSDMIDEMNALKATKRMVVAFD